MNDLFALETKEETGPPFLHGLVWLSMGKLGGITNVWVLSETLPAIQVSFCSLGAEMAENQKACMEYTGQEKTSGGLNLKHCNLHSRTSPDGTTLNRGRSPKRGFPQVQRG